MRLLVLPLAAAFTLLPPAGAREGVLAQLTRARAEIGASIPQDQQAAPLGRLERAQRALDAGRLSLALYLLEMPWETAQGWRFVKASSGVTSPAGFLKKWQAVGEPRPVAAPRRTLPVFVEALASAAEVRGVTTYHASRPYADDSGVESGLYYLGESHAVMQFAAMARALPWPPAPARQPRLDDIAAALDALDREMVTAYETMDRASHPTYIAASAALKQARTLNDRGRYAGALFEYLLSTYLFAPLHGPAPVRDATPERLADARRALAPGIDHSIADMFLQLADEGLSEGATAAQRRGATAVLDDVLPAYLGAIGGAITSLAAPAAADVTITLVRWPFT